MSKVVRGITKAVKKVATGIKNVAKKIVSIKAVKIIAIAVAAYFTAGAALGAIAGGSAAAAAGTSVLSGVVSGAAAGIGSAAAGLAGAGSAVLAGEFAGAASALGAGISGAATVGASAAGASSLGMALAQGYTATAGTIAGNAAVAAGTATIGAGAAGAPITSATPALEAPMSTSMIGEGEALVNGAVQNAAPGVANTPTFGAEPFGQQPLIQTNPLNPGDITPVSTGNSPSFLNGSNGYQFGSALQQPVSNPTVWDKLWSSQYTAPALISGGMQVGGNMLQGYAQGKAAEEQRDYESRLTEEERQRRNRNQNASLIQWTPRG